MINEGFLLIDKDKDMTSFAVVNRLRKLSGIKKIGHAGTLDPFATGLLILALGRSYTRQISDLQNFDKVYEIDVQLGATTPSLDPETPLEEADEFPLITQEDALNACQKFVGKIQQIPPIYSAKHVNGKRSYQLARAGKPVQLEPASVEIDDIQLLHSQGRVKDAGLCSLTLKVTCQKGCYMRSLARDLAADLGTLGYCSNLRRIRSGPFHVDDALSLNDLSERGLEQGVFQHIPATLS